MKTIVDEDRFTLMRAELAKKMDSNQVEREIRKIKKAEKDWKRRGFYNEEKYYEDFNGELCFRDTGIDWAFIFIIGFALLILFGFARCTYDVYSDYYEEEEHRSSVVNSAGRRAFNSANSCVDGSVSGCYQFENDQRELRKQGYELRTKDGVTKPHWVGE